MGKGKFFFIPMAARRLLCLIAALSLRVYAAPVAGPDAMIVLAGAVPGSVTKQFVLENYLRIWNSLAAGKPVDTGTLTVEYYPARRQPDLSVILPEWGGGGAIGRNRIVIPIDRSALPAMDLPRITRHELTHIVLERAYGPCRLPRWFHEGLAMTLSGELSFEEQVSLSRAIFFRRLFPLDSIDRVNRFSADGAVLAYSESHLAVSFLIEKYGADGIAEMLAAIRPAGGFDAALYMVFGLSRPEFERLFEAYLADRFRFLFFFSDTYLFWGMGALLVVVAFFVIRRRNAKREQRMEEEERQAADQADKGNSGEYDVEDLLDDLDSKP